MICPICGTNFDEINEPYCPECGFDIIEDSEDV